MRRRFREPPYRGSGGMDATRPGLKGGVRLCSLLSHSGKAGSSRVSRFLVDECARCSTH